MTFSAANETVFSLFTNAVATASQGEGSLSDFQWLVGMSNIVSAAIAIGGLAFIWNQFRQINRQNKEIEQSNHANMMLDLSQRWSEVLTKRYTVMQRLNADNTDDIDIDRKFNRDVSAFMASDFWRNELRPVLNFYEFLGLMIHQGNISKDEAFVLVSVDSFDWDKLTNNGEKSRRETSYKDGDFYQKVSPYLEFLRDYRNDIYAFYDYFLAELYHENRIKPFLPRNPKSSALHLRYDRDTRRYKWKVKRGSV